MALVARNAAKDSNFVTLARSLGTIDAVESFVRDRYVYRDESEEIVRTPQFMLADMGRIDNGRVVRLEGDCDDVATLFAAFTYALGFKTRLIAIRYTPENPNFEHVFTEVYDGGNWRILDATVPPGTHMTWIDDMTETL